MSSCVLGVVSIVYGAFAAMAQTDFKKLVAYSSVSHMGYVILASPSGVATAGTQSTRLLADGHERRDVPDDRPRHHLGRHVLPGRRDLRPGPSPQPQRVRRPVRQMPLYGGSSPSESSSRAWACRACAASSANSSWSSARGTSAPLLAIICRPRRVILTAGYILWTIQRVYLGAEYRGPHQRNYADINAARSCRRLHACWRSRSSWASARTSC